MKETQGNLEARGYVHTGNRELTNAEKAGMKREGVIRLLVSTVLWILFLPCLFVVMAGLVTLTDGGRTLKDEASTKWTLRIICTALALEVIGALTPGRRGRALRGDAKAGIVNIYQHQQVHPQQRPQYQWRQTPVAQVEVLPHSERVWSVNGQHLKNGWDALRQNYLLDQFGLRPIK